MPADQTAGPVVDAQLTHSAADTWPGMLAGMPASGCSVAEFSWLTCMGSRPDMSEERDGEQNF